MTILAAAQFLLAHVPSVGAAVKHNGGVTLEQRGGSWTRLGPYNIFNGNSSRKEKFLRSRQYQASLLKKGDCAVFDARLLHCGSGNEVGSERRRALLYFTLQNPAVLDYSGIEDKLSKHPDLSLDMTAFGFAKNDEKSDAE